MASINSSDCYTTVEEVNFLTELRMKNAVAFERYSALIMRGLRHYDASVDVTAVRRAIVVIAAGPQILV